MLSAMRYEIRLVGALSDSLLGAFSYLDVERCGPETVLVGQLPDQSALHGVLAEVEALGLELLEVRRHPESLELCDDDSSRHARVSLSVKEQSDIRRGELEPLDSAVDHVRGAPAGRLIVEYGDYECPYSLQAYRAIGRVEHGWGARSASLFAISHSPRSTRTPWWLQPPPKPLPSRIAFWDMHELLFDRQRALEDDELRRYAARTRPRRRMNSTMTEPAPKSWTPVPLATWRAGLATREVRGTPTLFIDGVVHRGAYDADVLLRALTP